jgi:hypothetical protein
MNIIDLTEGKLEEQLRFASEHEDTSLQNCIMRFFLYQGTEVRISNDFAPRSFYFQLMDKERYSMNGGIIYHGAHDNGGDGSSPTFSVNLTPIKGWSIHT